MKIEDSNTQLDVIKNGELKDQKKMKKEEKKSLKEEKKRAREQMKLEKKEKRAAQGKKPHKKIKKRWIFAGIAVILTVFFIVSNALAGNAALPVETINPEIGDVEATISTGGTVKSEKTKTYFSPVTGTIATLPITVGQTVQTGDVMLTYDMEDFEVQLKQAKLQKQANNNSYQSILNQDTEQQGKITEADSRLEVINKQLSDCKSNLIKYQAELTEKQNQISNGIAAQSYNITVEINELTAQSDKLVAEIKELEATDATSADTLATKEDELKTITKKLMEAQKKQAENAYNSQVAANNTDVQNLQTSISLTQTNISDLTAMKSEMEGQKSGAENSILDANKKSEYSANNQLANITGELAQEDYDTASAGITAEFDGVVTDVTAVQGAPTSAGMQLFSVQSNTEVKVEFTVSKYDLESISIGQKADLTIAGKEYKGTVSSISKVATVNETGNPVVKAEIHIDNADSDIFLGVEASIVIYTQNAKDVLLVPVETVNADKDGDFVYLVENGVIVKRSVVTGISSSAFIEIKEGLKKEDVVVAGGFTNITEGMLVTPTPVQ